MLRFSLFLLFALFLVAQTNETKKSDNVFDYEKLKFLYESGIRDYRIGSYYDAINEFNHLAKFPLTPFYLDSLFYLAKTYLQIGKRTGEKKYLWLARDFLNLYLVKGGKEDVDYYITKGHIYEILEFYERAHSNYMIALQKSKSKQERLRSIIGILRSSVWLKKLDLATKFIVMLSIEQLSKEQKREFDFLKGMYSFVKGDYKEAIKYFQKSYRNYENFLIENPEYYYIVAENSYRLGDFVFASRLFRRIINYVKNRKVIQKALLRLGDINFLQGDRRASMGYYYRLIKDFPNSPYTVVAKLKILYMMRKDPKIDYYVKKFFSKSVFVQEPEKFIVSTLVKNRNNYIGIFALADFGMNVFDIKSEKLYKRLSWELSLLSVNKLKYEHIEYFRRVWGERIFTIEPNELKELYRSNPEFFFTIFGKKELLKLADRLKKSGDRKVITRLYKKIAKRFQDDATLLHVVQELYRYNEFDEAVKLLERIKERDCNYWFWASKLCYVQKRDCRRFFRIYLDKCGKNPFYAGIFRTFLTKKVAINFIRENIDKIKKEYNDPVVKGFVRDSVDTLIQEKRYGKIIALLSPLVQRIDDCYLKSILALSYVRSGRIDLAKTILDQIPKCEEYWFAIAKNAILDAELEERMKNVGKD